MPAKGTTLPSSVLSFSVKVSTTVPAKGTTYLPTYHKLLQQFQLPCPRRARHRPATRCFYAVKFQLPCPRRARRPPVVPPALSKPSSFNYRAREGHDVPWFLGYRTRKVSTTVPAKGTTVWQLKPDYRGEFQLPCPRRARPAGIGCATLPQCFNYRAREGHDCLNCDN